MPEKQNKEPLTIQNMPELCTVKELAEFFRISVPIAKKWLGTESLPQSFKLGNKWLVPKEDIINLAKSLYGNTQKESEDEIESAQQ